MQLTILGGTGRTGKYVVQQALQKDYQVRVLARTPSKIEISDDRLKVIQGNALNPEDVNEAMEGSDAVISAMGPTKSTPDDLMEQSAAHMVTAMETLGIHRIVYLTGAGVRAEKDNPGIIDKLIGFLLKLFSGAILEDSKAGVRNIRASDLDWTIVRAPRLVDGQPKAGLKVGYVGDISSSMTRADLGKFLVEQVTDRKWVRKMPAVSN